MNITHTSGRAAVGGALLLAAHGAAAAPVLPVFADATFLPGTAIDHAYFPLLDLSTRVYVAEFEDEGEVQTERFELTVVGPGPVLAGVQTTARRDRDYEEDLLVEETFDYYAQDTAGNVWYFGEDVVNYVYDEDDQLIETNNESAWRAGVNSALPGLIMPVDLSPGYHYYQEFAPFDGALDEGLTLAADRDVSIAFGDFSDVLAVLELDPGEPNAREIKYYAPGTGLIMVEEELSLTLTDAALTFELVGVTPVPVPAPLLLFASGVAALGVVRRRTPR